MDDATAGLGMGFVVRGPNASPLTDPPEGLVVCVDGSDFDAVTIAVAARLASQLRTRAAVLCVPREIGPGSSADRQLLTAGCAARHARTLADSGVESEWDALGGRDPVAALTGYLRSAEAVAVPVIHARAWAHGRRSRVSRRVLRLVATCTSPIVIVDGSPPPRPPTAPCRPRPGPQRQRWEQTPDLRSAPRAYLRSAPPDRRSPRVDAPPASTMRWWRTGTIAVVVGLAALGVGSTVQSNYYTYGAGNAIPVDGRVVGDDVSVFPTTGRILMTTVELERLSLIDALSAWAGDGEMVHETRVSLRNRRTGIDEMARSKSIALSVALDRVDLDETPRATAHIDTTGIGGGSAGLAFALTLIDLLSPGELTGGHVVAATGTLDQDGRVGSVHGLAAKVVAARDRGAELFMVPAAQLAEATSYAGSMTVIGVHTVDDALEALRSRGGDPHW